jgi:hypothetical protein
MFESDGRGDSDDEVWLIYATNVPFWKWHCRNEITFYVVQKLTSIEMYLYADLETTTSIFDCWNMFVIIISPTIGRFKDVIVTLHQSLRFLLCQHSGTAPLGGQASGGQNDYRVSGRVRDRHHLFDNGSESIQDRYDA